MKIRKGDNVMVISGKDNGRKGKVLRVFPKEGRILVEGINQRKKHNRPRKSGEKGQTITIFAPIQSSNVKLVCSQCGQPARVGYKIEGDRKFRVCKKCGKET